MSLPPVDPPDWLRTLPEAPEYRPTLAEFVDPIAYILKIERDASRYGICKIVPPLPAPSREATVQRLKASFASNAAATAPGDASPTFPTRLQQVGLSTKNRRGANRRVWESGERYTLEAFRTKARDMELPRHATPPKHATPLQLEALFWGACAARPFNVEYGNDMPGSGFAEPEGTGDAAAAPRDVGDTDWNMRVAPRARGSLLRAMSRDVAGVTTPMLYVAMLYSWFAWHVEDHELHSLNYLHFGKPKTWYGVPRDAMLAFEDAVRVYGYGDDLNAIMAFQTLNQKTTVLSPAVLLSAGVPCCRLVQNPGEFVITFPGAYHSGFSHGFNCGEATNIATPLWLQVAKEAAIRRASTNCGPMVSHYQLLYELALSLRQREPKDFHTIPRSSRLRDKKKKDEADIIVKENFVGNVIENNNLLSILLDKTSCIIVPEIAFPRPFFSKMMVPEVTVKQSLAAGHCSISRQAVENMSVDVALDKIIGVDNVSGPQSVTEASFYACNRKLYETKYGEPDTAALGLSTSEMRNGVTDKHRSNREGGLLDHGRLPCVQCGILSFACVAIIQPREAAVQFVMSREGISSSAKVGELSKSDSISNWITENHEMVSPQGQTSEARSVNLAQVSDHCRQLYDRNTSGCTSALGLLASMYESSDSEEEKSDNVSTDREKHAAANQGKDIQFLGSSGSCPNTVQHERASLHLYEEGCETRNAASLMKPIDHNSRPITWSSRHTDIGHFARLGEPGTSYEQCSVYLDLVDDLTVSGVKVSPDTCVSRAKSSIEPDVLTMLKYNKDSCRMHVFCLEHALETWTQLQQIGGANVMLLCHPEYPRAESAAKLIAEELGLKHDWKDITFEEATKDDIRRIQLALQDEDAEPASSDWAVQMGINIYYSAKQSKSPLYSKQIPYNSIIYEAFGQENPDTLTDYGEQRSGAMKKRVVGWWCGKAWMSNQAHPFLARSKAMFAAKSHDKVQDEPSTLGNSMISRSPSKRIPRKKRGDSMEKSGAKKKRCSANDETALHGGSLGTNAEASSDQSENFNVHDKHEGDEIEEAPSTQQYQQHKSQNVDMKLSSKKQKSDKRNSNLSKKQKSDKRNSNLHEVCDEDNDVDCWLNIDAGDNAAIGDLDNSPQGLDDAKAKSPGKLQGSKGKSSKGKASDDSLDGDKKLQKMNKKSISRKQNSGKINRQFREDYNEDNTLDNLLDVESGVEATLDNLDKVSKDKTDDVKVEPRGKRRSGKDDKRSSNFHDEDNDVDCWHAMDSGDNATTGILDNSQQQRLEAVKLKSGGKSQSCKRKSSKGKTNDNPPDGDKKLQVVNAKSSSRKQKVDSINRQFREGPDEDNPVDNLLKDKDEATRDNCHKVSEEQTNDVKVKSRVKTQTVKRKTSKRQAGDKAAKFPCDIEGCDMSFSTMQDLLLHKRDICTVKGCKKKFFCHKYLLQHRKVHIDERPLKCTFEGCKKTFKWPWAKTEHMRVHTGVRPYVCKEPGCTQTFRFVSDFSRHKRKTGHSSDKRNKEST